MSLYNQFANQMDGEGGTFNEMKITKRPKDATGKFK